MLWSRWPRFVRLFSQTNDRKSWLINYLLVTFWSALWLLWAAHGLAYAAVELSAFDVLVLPNSVVLEWQTVSEYDMIGFEVWYKPETASQSAYQLLGKRIAQGSPQHGVTYRMDVTAALKADQAYCFQLRELPISGDRGEILNRCGYGLGISAQPTPTPTSLFTSTPIVTETLPLTTTTELTTGTGLTGTNLLTTGTALTGVVEPFPTLMGPTTTLPTENFPVVPDTTTGQDTGGVLPTATPTAPYTSVLPTPLIEGQGQSPPLTPALPPPTSPLTTTPIVTVAVDGFDAAAVNGSTASLSQTAGLTTTMAYSTPSTFASVLPTPAAAAAVANPPYIVLTATPTPVAVATVPTFTPYPTTLPSAAANLMGLPIPDTQNLMIMLLCGVFSGASGLGILGLVSTLLYMRSRANRPQNRANQRQLT